MTSTLAPACPPPPSPPSWARTDPPAPSEPVLLAIYRSLPDDRKADLVECAMVIALLP